MRATSFAFFALAGLALAACGSKSQPTGTTTPGAPATADAAPQAVAPAPPDAAPPAPPDAAPQAVAPAPPDAAPPAPPPGGGPGALEKKLVNIKVLPKDWSHDQVVDFMKKVVSPGLGVKCVACHDKDDFAKDTKKKERAREMIKMMWRLNKDYMKGQMRITCVTCHDGKEEPGK
jgi:hypothetical protein